MYFGEAVSIGLIVIMCFALMLLSIVQHMTPVTHIDQRTHSVTARRSYQCWISWFRRHWLVHSILIFSSIIVFSYHDRFDQIGQAFIIGSFFTLLGFILLISTYRMSDYVCGTPFYILANQDHNPKMVVVVKYMYYAVSIGMLILGIASLCLILLLL